MNVLVLMSGGFHPFHPGHLALYNSAKQAFPGADVVVGATNVQKDRPFSFKDKATLATIAGVDKGHFVEVNRQFSVKGEPNIEGRIQDANDTILIFVRSEKDAGDPALQPWKLNPDGSIPMTKGSKNHPPRPTSDYLLPYAGNQKKLQPMTKHAYIAFLPVKKFSSNMTSATQIRNTWPTLDDQDKKEFSMNLYPATQQNSKLLATVVNILNRNLGEISEPVVAPEKSAIKKLKAEKLKEHIQRIRPLMSEASAEQKLKLLKLMKVALKESQQGVAESEVDEAKIHFTDPSIKVNLYYIPPKLEREGRVQNVAHNIPYSTVQPLIDRLMQKYPNMKAEYLVVGPVGQDQYGERLREESDEEELTGNVRAVQRTDPEFGPAGYDYYHNDEPVEPGTKKHSKIQDIHMLHKYPEYDVLKKEFGNPTIKPGAVIPPEQWPENQPSRDRIVPDFSNPKGPDYLQPLDPDDEEYRARVIKAESKDYLEEK